MNLKRNLNDPYTPLLDARISSLTSSDSLNIPQTILNQEGISQNKDSVDGLRRFVLQFKLAYQAAGLANLNDLSQGISIDNDFFNFQSSVEGLIYSKLILLNFFFFFLLDAAFFNFYMFLSSN